MVPIAFGISLQFSGLPVFAQSPNVVVQWNQIAQAQFGIPPSSAQRSRSVMHIAMFDAINAIEER